MPENEPLDPPLDAHGELVLSEELEAIANTLRGDAARLAEAAVPQQAQARLCELRRTRHTRNSRAWHVQAAAALAIVAALGCAIGWTAGLRHTRHASERNGAQNGQATAPAAQAVADVLPARQPGTAVVDAGSELEGVDQPGNVFLAADEANDAMLRDVPVTAEDNIDLLQRTLERYRAALVYQQDRILAAEEELARLRAELARLKSTAPATPRTKSVPPAAGASNN